MKTPLENGMEYFQVVLQSSPVGMLVFDENLEIVFINSVAEELFGQAVQYPSGEHLKGRRCGDFLGCPSRHRNSKGCGYSEECEYCPLDQTLKKTLDPLRKKQSLRGEASIRSEEQYLPNFIRYKANAMDINGKHYAVLAIEDITDQKTTELRLKRTQEIGGIGSWELDVEKNLLTWSDETYRLFGYVPQAFDATYEAFLEIIHPEDREKVDKAYTDSLKQSLDGYEIEHRIIRKDTGEIRILHEKCAHSKDEGGKIIRSEGMVQDVTERKKTEEALKKSEERYRALFEKSAQGIILHDNEGKILEVNQSALEIFGYSSEEFRTMHPLNIVRAEEKESVLEDAKRIEKEDTINREHRCIRKDGREIVVTLRMKMIAKDLIQVIIQDITLERKRERELRLLTRAIEQSAETVVITDRTGKIEYVNPAFTKTTGYSPEEAVGKNPKILNAGKTEKEYYKELWKIISSGGTWRGEFRNRKKNGEEYWEVAVISPVYSENGEITHYVAVKSDITWQKELEQHKEDVDRIMRHDLKTPLNGIINLPQLIATEENVTHEQKEILTMIEEAGHTMLTMIDSSLDMFKMETGKYIFSPTEIDAITVVKKVIGQNHLRTSEKELESQILFNDAPLNKEHTFPITSEATLFHRMFSNFFINAVEASPIGATITVIFDTQGNRKVSIRNKGTVPKSIRPMFFEKYSTQGKTGGTGIGTYSAKLMADTMNYTLTMKTSDEENTTEVTIHISSM